MAVKRVLPADTQSRSRANSSGSVFGSANGSKGFAASFKFMMAGGAESRGGSGDGSSSMGGGGRSSDGCDGCGASPSSPVALRRSSASLGFSFPASSSAGGSRPDPRGPDAAGQSSLGPLEPASLRTASVGPASLLSARPEPLRRKGSGLLSWLAASIDGAWSGGGELSSAAVSAFVDEMRALSKSGILPIALAVAIPLPFSIFNMNRVAAER